MSHVNSATLFTPIAGNDEEVVSKGEEIGHALVQLVETLNTSSEATVGFVLPEMDDLIKTLEQHYNSAAQLIESNIADETRAQRQTEWLARANEHLNTVQSMNRLVQCLDECIGRAVASQ